MAKTPNHLTSHLDMRDLAIPTYIAGLLQAQAYRGLKHSLSAHLEKAGLAMPEWALMGLLHDHGHLRLSNLAELMRVEASLSTTLVNKLEAKGWVQRGGDPSDSRAKQVMLTPGGKMVVERTERDLRTVMQEYTADISPAELVVYMNVLTKLAARGHKPS